MYCNINELEKDLEKYDIKLLYFIRNKFFPEYVHIKIYDMRKNTEKLMRFHFGFNSGQYTNAIVYEQRKEFIK